jgi:transposase
MDRYVLTDAQWAKMEPHCLGKPSDPGRSGADNRRFIEAVLWIARTGSPCTALGFWDTGLKPTPPERAVEAAACDIQPG